MGKSSPQKRIIAAPPSVTKMGEPKTVATSSVAIAGQTSLAGSVGGCVANHTSRPLATKTTARPHHLGEAFHSNRPVTSAKPMGVTVCTHQMGIVPTRKLPLARSVFTNSMPATVRKSVMVVAAVPLKSAAKTFHLGGRIVGSADMASSRLSRAASAPPSIPMSSVQCWTKVVAPGMPEAKALRRNASSNGSTISATRMESARPICWPSTSR